jgi:hypothetical protein
MRTSVVAGDWWPALRSRLLRSGSLRGLRALAVLSGLACLAGVVQAAHPIPSPLLAAMPEGSALQPYDQPGIVGAAPLHIVEPAYSLWAEPGSAVVTLASPSGHVYTSLPLTVLAGRSSFPDGTVARTTLEDGVLQTRMIGLDNTVLAVAVLRPAAQSFTVSYSAPIGPDRGLTPSFFSDGARGLAMSTIEDGYSPDARRPSPAPLPEVSTIGRAPFAPPPFDFQLRSEPGWFGIGLVQVPDASTMRLGADGAITLDYPLAHSGSPTTDFGAGAPVSGRVRFPDFVVTFAADPDSGLRAYHDALVARHAVTVAAPPGSRPAWWSQPIVDTWGEQMATGAQRSSPIYGSAWVRHFVDTWRARYHLQHFTVVIDSRWQQRIGDAMPDVVRFGGIAGMRSLIDDLHAQGLHVLLWWPMWAHRIDKIPMTARESRIAGADHVIDPTLPDFGMDMATTVEQLLGSGPDGLAADGLKLDWQYDIPQTLARPGVASGALALYRYMAAVHTDAHAIRGDAMIDASAVAPQFAAVADTVRLYDAWSAAEWDRRAAIVADVDPDMLIDGDGWQVDASDIVPHTVASTVYGTPAMYFSSTWVGHRPIAADLSQELGAVLSLATLKGQGQAVALPGGEWQYQVGATVTARTFDGERALVVRPSRCTATWSATVAGAVSGRQVVPVTGRRLVSAVDGWHRRVNATRVDHGVTLTMVAGEIYVLTFSGGC